jgi:adenylate cyclase
MEGLSDFVYSRARIIVPIDSKGNRLNWNMFRRLILPALLITIAMILADSVGLWNPIESRLLDVRFRLRGTIVPHPNLAVAVISSDEFKEYGPWPLPNEIQGKFIEAATNFGVGSVVYDAVFSRTTQPKGDVYFRKMVKQSARVHFPLRFSPFNEAIPIFDSLVPPGVRRFRHDKLVLQEGVIPMKGLQTLPLPGLDTVAKSMGFVLVKPDDDGTVRRTPLFVSSDSVVFPHLGLQVWARYLKVDMRTMALRPLSIAYQNDKRIPLDGHGQMLINWPGTWENIPKYSFLRIVKSYQQIMEGKKPLIPIDSMLALQDKILLVGVADPSSYESISIPFENQFPVLGMQFAILNTLLSGNSISSISLIARTLFLLILTMVLLFLLLRKNFWWHVGAVLLVAVTVVASQWLFQSFQIWMPITGIVVNAFLIILWYVISTQYQDRLAKNRVESIFARYHTKEVMDELIDSPMWTEVGGRKVMVTVLFSDIRGFTAISEIYDPKLVVEQLNEYLSVMTPIIFAHKGTIDKIIGDEIMAYFGAPIYPEMHAWRAVRAAMDMQTALIQLREKWKLAGKPDMQIGIGINTGFVIMGNIGTDQYMDFTLIGDSVNLGARLCSAATAGEILISSGTYHEVFRHVVVSHSRETTVKGKVKPVRVYSIASILETESRDKRNFERFEVSLPIRLWRADASNEAAWLVDIGGGGFCCIASGDWAKDEVVALALQLPNGIEIREAKARLVNTDIVEEGLRIKAVFVEISDPDREEIIKMARHFGEDDIL